MIIYRISLFLVAWIGFGQFSQLAIAQSGGSTRTRSMHPASFQHADLSIIDNGVVRIGMDANKGGSITWISSESYPQNIVNYADPGRLIQQSYYAGDPLDRTSEGQWKAWSPWTWNPIQGGGVGSWARATRCEKTGALELYSECTPKLWDMPDEDAEAIMRQWVEFEDGLPAAIRVRCQFQSLRKQHDRWGATRVRHQEVPACYFVRSFSDVRTYRGKSNWEINEAPLGPPWSKTSPPQNAMAFFSEQGQGIALYSPTADGHWNYGPHSNGKSVDPKAKPCMHVAPISSVQLAPRSLYEYRYWLVVGDQATIERCLDQLHEKYADERATLIKDASSAASDE